MRKRRDGLAKAGTVFLALLAALALTGMGYGIWSDTLNISAAIETGSWGSELSPGTPDAGVSCIIDGNKLKITITAATVGPYRYTNFDIHNTGTVPIKIQNISIFFPFEVPTTVSGVYENDVIDGGATAFGTVNMQVTVAGTHNVEVTIDTILWNQ